MSELLGQLKKKVAFLRRTPFHPQWLLSTKFSTTSWVARNARGVVLDIGCADRWAERRLLPECRYLALDYPVTGAAIYRARPDIFATASALPLGDACIDTVLFLEVAEHLAEPDCAFAEIARVIRPGGLLLMSVPFLYPIHDAPHDFQRYTEHGLTRRLEMAGLRVESLQATTSSLEAAGMLTCLALAGSAVESIRRRHLSMLLAPLLLLLVPAVNLGAWLMGMLLPHWPAFTAGYRIQARRPASQASGS